ncbi:MAG TPA: MOSC domain-containing protein, partial [Candidatus Wunengus sp. YC61]|uniref:MOSC domain-containing protein n=1 Tax=Candidatus Wunengus sp. YC61 TaxID=3367698 RepID=UPI00402777A5
PLSPLSRGESQSLKFLNMNNNPRVIYLQIKPARGSLMQSVSVVEAVAEQGLRNDSQFGRSKRQVLIIESETLEEFELPIGDVRENITVEGIKLAGLPAGTRMHVGSALLEVTMDCTPCKFIEAKRPGLRDQMVGRRGTLFRVIEGGKIKLGDEVRIVA